MGSNSVFSNPGQIFGGSNSFFHVPGQMFDIFKPKMPDVPDPGAPPDPGQVRQQELGKQIQDEQIARAQRTLYTGGSGLLDQPTTASRVLLGS